MKLNIIPTWIFIALVLVAGVFASCGKVCKLAVYLFYCDTSEFTSEGEIQDSELRAAYSALRVDLLTDLSKLRLNDKWDTWVVNDKFSVEDVKAEAEYDKNLPADYSSTVYLREYSFDLKYN